MSKGLRVCSAPGDFNEGGDEHYIHHLLTTPTGKESRLPDVVVTTESKDFRMKDAVKGTGYTAIQVLTDKAHMGCAMAVSKDVEITEWGQHIGAQPFIGRHRIKMLTRYQTWARLESEGFSYFLDGVHYPKTKFQALQPRYGDNVLATIAGHPHALVLGDYNQPHAEAARKLGLKVAIGLNIVGICYREGHLHAWDFTSSRWGIVNKYTDHPATYCTVLPEHAWTSERVQR